MIWKVVLCAALIAATAIPADAVDPVDSAVTRIRVTDLWTSSSTEAHAGDPIRFVAVGKNFGPGVAEKIVFTSTPDANCVGVYGDHEVHIDPHECWWLDVPPGGKDKAMKIVLHHVPPGTLTFTACAATDGDVRPENDCATGTIEVLL